MSSQETIRQQEQSRLGEKLPEDVVELCEGLPELDQEAQRSLNESIHLEDRWNLTRSTRSTGCFGEEYTDDGDELLKKEYEEAGQRSRETRNRAHSNRIEIARTAIGSESLDTFEKFGLVHAVRNGSLAEGESVLEGAENAHGAIEEFDQRVRNSEIMILRQDEQLSKGQSGEWLTAAQLEKDGGLIVDFRDNDEKRFPEILVAAKTSGKVTVLSRAAGDYKSIKLEPNGLTTVYNRTNGTSNGSNWITGSQAESVAFDRDAQSLLEVEDNLNTCTALSETIVRNMVLGDRQSFSPEAPELTAEIQNKLINDLFRDVTHQRQRNRHNNGENELNLREYNDGTVGIARSNNIHEIAEPLTYAVGLNPEAVKGRLNEKLERLEQLIETGRVSCEQSTALDVARKRLNTFMEEIYGQL